MQKLLQGHLDQRNPGDAAGPVAGSDGVECRERRVHKRAAETVFGTVDVGRVGYARPRSRESPCRSMRCSTCRRSVTRWRCGGELAAAASRSFDEALLDLSDSTGAVVPKRQAEQLAAGGEPVSEESVVVLTFDGKGGGAASREPSGVGGNGSRSPRSIASSPARRSTRSGWRRWPPSTRSRRSCGVRRSSCRA